MRLPDVRGGLGLRPCSSRPHRAEEMTTMGTPHVHCMSQLPTAHEPAGRVGPPLGDGQRSGGRARVAGEVGGAQLERVGAGREGWEREGVGAVRELARA